MSIADLQAHDDIQARIWNDERGMPPGTREVALAMAWVLYREPQHPPGKGYWLRVRELLGHDGRVTRGGHGWRLHDLIAGDAPRYEPGRRYAMGGSCEGPRVRPYRPRQPADAGRCIVSRHHPHLGDCQFTQISWMHLDSTIRPYPGPEHATPDRDDRVCGAHGTIQVTERDMVTGWETARWFCSRHRDRAREVKAQIAARGEPPEPIPNCGGLLPRYFDADWAVIYARYCEKSWTVRMVTGWTVPYHGVDADQWPVPGRTPVPRRPRLSLVTTGESA